MSETRRLIFAIFALVAAAMGMHAAIVEKDYARAAYLMTLALLVRPAENGSAS